MKQDEEVEPLKGAKEFASESFAPSGALFSFRPIPTAHAVGYYLPPLTGLMLFIPASCA